MVEVVQTYEFEFWLANLKDLRSKIRILQRVDRLVIGNPGDARPIGQGLSELRLNFGPGYRVYYMQEEDTLVLLLCGGSKSTQQRDIEKAHQLARRWFVDKEQEEHS